MPSRLHSSLANIGVVGILAGALFLFFTAYDAYQAPSANAPEATTTAETAAVTESFPTAASTSPLAITVSPASTTASSAIAGPKPVQAPVVKTAKSASSPSTQPSSATTSAPEAARIQNPYDSAPESFDTVNTAARGALVNILCMPRDGGSLSPISGSGVIIDPRGVILTNAHVAQYVLLSESSAIDLSCQIRTGSPASAEWSASILYIPPVWVSAHVSEINEDHPTGTGEHDYALLLITGTLNNSSLPSSFPYLPFDTRDAIGFLGDQVLGASYPAEFLGGMAAENDLYPVSSVSPINQLLTFSTDTVDVIAIGGVIEAQSGSSGGPVVNQWGRLIGIIATTSDAPTTAQRDLRAITMSYIDSDLSVQTGSDLSKFLDGDLNAKVTSFNANIAPGLLNQYIQTLSK